MPYDDRYHEPSIEMYRAAAANYRAMEADGLYMSDLPWPHTEREYQILREMSDPDISARKSKHFFVGRAEAEPGCFAAERYLPAALKEGVPARVAFMVGDIVNEAREDGELAGVILGVRVVQCCPEDTLSFRFNERVVSPSEVRHFYGGLVSYSAARGGLPARIDTHYWFTFDLPLDLVREGQNEVEVTLERIFLPLETDRLVHQVELRLEYKAPLQPTGGQI